jgi:hypothetical protein
MCSDVMLGNVTRLPYWAEVSNVALVGCPKAAWRNLMTSFVLGNSYMLIAVSAMSMLGLIVGSSTMVTIHNPLSSHRPWRDGGEIEEMLMSLAWKTFTPCCPVKNTVKYPLFANVHTLMSALWRIPGTVTASLAPLERARVGSNAVLDAGSSVLLAVMKTLSNGLLSCIPRGELPKVLDAPESNMACVIVGVYMQAMIARFVLVQVCIWYCMVDGQTVAQNIFLLKIQGVDLFLSKEISLFLHHSFANDE